MNLFRMAPFVFTLCLLPFAAQVLNTWTKRPFTVVFEVNMGPVTFEDQETNFGAKR